MPSEPIEPLNSVLFLCYGDPEECQLCGGWLHSGDPPEVPEGEPGIAGKYCSHDCHDEAVKLGWCEP